MLFDTIKFQLTRHTNLSIIFGTINVNVNRLSSNFPKAETLAPELNWWFASALDYTDNGETLDKGQLKFAIKQLLIEPETLKLSNLWNHISSCQLPSPTEIQKGPLC